MTSAEIAVALFAACNSARVLAYIPQVVRFVRDADGARAISCLTWGSFTIANLSTVSYALLFLSDWRTAAIFGANAACCLIIVALTAYKRLSMDAARRGRATIFRFETRVLGLRAFKSKRISVQSLPST
jgi:hypothetical protein